MAIVINGTTNDILVNGVSVATDAEVSSAVAPLATTAYVDGKMVLMTAQNSTSGTAIDFTGIPSWAKRITVMFNGVSINGTSLVQMQIGTSSGVETTGYVSTSQYYYTGNAAQSSVSSFVIDAVGNAGATNNRTGSISLTNISSTTWVSSGNIAIEGAVVLSCAGKKSLSGTLDRIRITTVNGTDTFDAGSINIMYEG